MEKRVRARDFDSSDLLFSEGWLKFHPRAPTRAKKQA